MTSFISAVTLVVPDYDEAIFFYVGSLGFKLLEDVKLGEKKRWIKVAPPGAQTAILLAQADGDAQSAAIGCQTGGRVSFFLETDDFDESYKRFAANGVRFLEEPRSEAYGTVVVFSDPFGNLWDLIEAK
ncbi:MAG: VOC family protein [Pseudomonadota bacterium]